MDEPAHGAHLLEADGAVAVCWRWPQAGGPSLVWLRPHTADAPLTPSALVALARTCAGEVVATEDPAGSAALAEAGLPMVRHVHGLAADPAVVAATQVRTDLRMEPLRAASLEELAAVRVAAFPPGHPDHSEETPEARVAAYALELEDPDNPVHHASRSAWLDGELVGTCLVTDSRHFPGFVGPWVQNLSRLPGEAARGTGAALLVESARAVTADGGRYLGLAVTDANPARRLYERMGWSGIEMWLHHVPDASSGNVGGAA
jgi:GNAT superfamily N-acetyltransferase